MSSLGMHIFLSEEGISSQGKQNVSSPLENRSGHPYNQDLR